jgi:hypothetical protein
MCLTLPSQRADRVLDRRGGVDAVLVVQVDVFGAKAPQRPLDGDADVLRGAVELLGVPVAVGDQAELGGQDHLVAPVGDGPPDEFLVGVGP